MADNFIKSYNLVENTYMQYKNDRIPMDNAEFTEAFFNCFDYLSSLTEQEVEMLKSDVSLHCKIVMFDTIKLLIMAQNPRMISIPGFYRNF